jgi:hypothetical protein
MTTIADIYQSAERLINQVLRKEMIDQGHHLTGAMEDSLSIKISRSDKVDTMEGFAAYYAHFVNEGVAAASASFKQVPFLIEYFKKRWLPENEATSAAFATVKTWMKEGMPTQASKRFSQTGSRTNMVDNAFVGAQPVIDGFIGDGLDFIVEESFQKEKTETV